MNFGVITTHDPESLGGMQAAASWLNNLIESKGHTTEIISYPLAKWEKKPLPWAIVGEPLRMMRLTKLAKNLEKNLDKTIIHAPAGFSALPGLTIHHINTLEYCYARYSKFNPNFWKLRYLNSLYDKLSSWGHRLNVAVSHSQATWLRQMGIIIDDIIYYATDTDTFRPAVDETEKATIRKQFSLHDDKFVIASVGRYDGRKNWGRICRLAQLCPDFTFLFAGPTREEFACLPNNCSALGILSKQDTAKLYRAANLFLSTTYSEANALTWLEAMSSGLPLLVTHVGAAGDFLDYAGIFQHSVVGFALDEQYNALMYLVKNDTLRHELGKVGRELVMERANEELVARKYCEILSL